MKQSAAKALLSIFSFVITKELYVLTTSVLAALLSSNSTSLIFAWISIVLIGVLAMLFFLFLINRLLSKRTGWLIFFSYIILELTNHFATEHLVTFISGHSLEPSELYFQFLGIQGVVSQLINLVLLGYLGILLFNIDNNTWDKTK